MFDSWLTLSGFGMDLQTLSRSLDPEGPGAGGVRGRPAKFATHRDPRGRFELGYPSGWELEDRDGILVRSKSLGSWAKVDVLPSGEGPWSALRDAVTKAGGSLTILKEIAGPPCQLRGLLDLGSACFEFRARAYARGSGTIVLSCGIDAAAGPPLKKYAEQVLSAIRREFKVGDEST
jgi:hypothetical protein